MKRIVTHLLVAAGLAAGAIGVAQAHTDLNIGLSLGVPAPVYEQAYAQPTYAAPYDGGYYHHWDHRDRGDWHHRDDRWNHGDDHRGPEGHGWHG
jgi:hypothetical protein